jgi:hypothetical protein
MTNDTPGNRRSRSRWIAITAIMSALALVGNYVLVAIPNVELGSGVLFVTAYLFGIEMALWSVLLVSIIFAFFNPWGPFIPTIWVAQVIGWLFMVTTGSLMGREEKFGQNTRDVYIELALVGAVVTLFFDLITTLGYVMWYPIPYFAAIIAGIPFIAVHVISNAILFPAIVPRLDITIKDQLRPIFSRNQSLS